MKLKETRLLAPGKLRQLCISENWYTCGTNAAYEHLLHDQTHNGRDHMTTEDITRVARTSWTTRSPAGTTGTCAPSHGTWPRSA